MTRFVGLASLGITAACLLGCGLRSDPDYSPVCVDDSIAAVGETGGTSGVMLEPRAGSCEAPIDLPAGETIVVRGSLGGCSGTEGWCGGTGAEDVYRIGSVSSDVFVDFLPQETNFNPVLRVVRGEDPCLEAPIEQTEVCADIKNSVPGRGFYDQGGPADTYYIIVDTELGDSGQYGFELRFGDEASQDDCIDALDEQTIELATGGNFVWEASLEDEQGRVDSGCSAPGDEDIFPLILTGGGTLTATVEVVSGDIQPIVSLRSGCATSTELACGGLAIADFNTSTNAYLVVDQLGAADGRYRLNIDYL